MFAHHPKLCVHNIVVPGRDRSSTHSACVGYEDGYTLYVFHFFLILFIVLERETCQVQIPKGHNPRKIGWTNVVGLTSHYQSMPLALSLYTLSVIPVLNQ